MLSRRNIWIIISAVGVLALVILLSTVLSKLDNFHHIYHEIDEDGPSSSLNGTGKGLPHVQMEGYHLHINVGELVMYVYKDGSLITTYPISGGKRSTPSPQGSWRIIHKSVWGEGFGGVWLGLNVPWGEYGIHGTISPWSIGNYNSSGGCIRMKNEDAKELYGMVKYGATVMIEDSSGTFREMMDGDVGSDVFDMQKRLGKLGYYNGAVDGIFGSGLKGAVMKFQEKNGIFVTGIVNRKTYDAINGHKK